MADIKELVGKTISRIEGAEKYSFKIKFHCTDGSMYDMYHCQDCCETVLVEDVVGDIEDLVGTEILSASEEVNSSYSYNLILNPARRLKIIDPCHFLDDSYTWTYYKFATIKGYVDLRWYGTSNGYYSETVYLEKVT